MIIAWKVEEAEAEAEVDGIAEVWDMVVILICWEGVILNTDGKLGQ